MSTDESPSADPVTFADLQLNAALLHALRDVGYEIPTPIQAATIPALLAGRDLVGQAQTGTGKTAAFALPLLNNIDLKARLPQILVLTPTRELTIQVAEAFQKYARHLAGFHVLPIYGGQAYDGQIRALKRGVHVVVGTPGRVMDHMRRGTLQLSALKGLVLDEGDEMLRMGFIEAVEWILEQTPANRQTALFSATMPPPIRKVASRYLRDPVSIKIQEKTETAKTIRQRYLRVHGPDKLDALTRILEVETCDGILVFVRTKTATAELAEKLVARGFACETLNGDMAQALREKTVERFKRGKLDILVATDVAARGLDVDRISHVINYDIPHDTGSYVHRIGRTGRAGRSGEAILFIVPREQHLLKAIEQATRHRIEEMRLPPVSEINEQRMQRFKQRIVDAVRGGDHGFYRRLVDDIHRGEQVEFAQIAAALASLLQGDEPLLLAETRKAAPAGRHDRPVPRTAAPPVPKGSQKPFKAKSRDEAPRSLMREDRGEESATERFRLDVGTRDKVKAANIVGAIANEAGLDSRHIGHIDIHEDYTTVDLPAGMPKDVFNVLRHTWVCGKKLNLQKIDGVAGPPAKPAKGGRRRST